ncbi:MAG: helix-turn-helix domain-containing protein [Firmicutes bacterium]|nr:helix-turn-helix domain-containing protein [[Eubacterium] siraeum]MCM1487787.1 helix-turn-helix domain-containing protein [Bacillota bacterium]
MKNKEQIMNVAERITYLREKKGITVNKLANLAGISQSHLREIELGQRNPTVETLSYFCDALGISLEEFFREGEAELDPCLMTAAKKLTEVQQRKLADFLFSVQGKIN